jgi:ABC-2 type transport system permease protein
MRKVKYIAIKEARHILRDPRSLSIIILMPILMTLFYGYVINLDPKNMRLGVLDFERTSESRELVEKFYLSGHFKKPESVPTLSDPEKTLRSGAVNAILTIKSGFTKALTNLSHYELGLLVDGSDVAISSAAVNYSNILLRNYLIGKLPYGVELSDVVIAPQVLYNSDLKSSHFFVPGMIAIFLMMISALLTSITIAREKETGTLEQLLTSPVSPRQIIIGKVLPYIALALLDAVLVVVFAVINFGVPFVGSFLLLLLFATIYLVTALSLGILISTLVSTQQVAMMAAQLITVLPSVMLSGFIFEIKNMPRALQFISYLVPAKYFILIIRGIMLKGSDITVLWTEAVSLAVITIVLLAVATRKFQSKIG